MSFSIGLFDSGVGGLSVLKTLEAQFPAASFVYFADGAHFPFGTKSKIQLVRYASQGVAFLLSQKVDLIVIACHTASVHTLEILKGQFPVPILGMVEPTLAAVKKLKANRRIGILATEATIQSGLYEKALAAQIENVQVFSHASPELIASIERGITPSPDELRQCLKPLLDKQLDVVILASTHFPHIQHQIEEEQGPHIHVLNPAQEVALQVAPFVQKKGAPLPHLIYTSGNHEALQAFLQTHPLARSYSLENANF